MGFTDPILSAAAGLEPNVEAFEETNIFKAPEFKYEFSSKAFPMLNGPVVMRYPTIGDSAEIERLARMSGAGPVGEILATAMVLVKAAPSSWYVKQRGKETPSLAVDLIPETEGLIDMVAAFRAWRDSFRRTGLRGGGGGADGQPGGAVAG